ncbi:MAG TPA: nitroreductase family deazaflavin-dependent oxidoreductase [Solirubrobacteraceae bacterium]|jgi:deazaflavin-dependent oxidoreductase (nitroreductase family)|nr:nitroreductase family deazaflavin-dependent oxidoreductase [Solirubrobacteraceae bacterium]
MNQGGGSRRARGPREHPEKPGLERPNHPLLRSKRLLSALMLPLFAVRPPAGFGLLTTTGRKTGKSRRKCVRAVRTGDGTKAYVVAIAGHRTGWLKNLEASPRVSLRSQDGTFAGVARPLVTSSDIQAATAVYCAPVHAFDYIECVNWRKGRPTRAKIRELHTIWCERGSSVAIELDQPARPAA